MSDFTIQFPIEELAERVRVIIQEEIAASVNDASKPCYNDSPINTKELCEFLGITEPTIIKMRRKKKIPFFQIGSCIRYSKNEVLDALRKNK
jgi:excisionase family DNA binding protein